uniref:Battenin n=1 Tax=Angiostrongylus cantonensis TaxID=6313 RepID=A0A0K0DAR1_ANGCA
MCSPISVGVVLICVTLPALVVKLTCPFFIHRVPYGIRHFMVCTLQATALLVTAFAESVPAALVGVSTVAVAGGLGEITYLGLAGHYSKHTISTWSSGTGMSGLIGAFSYAGMTDPRLLALTSTQAMLVMLIMPAIFAFTYYVILVRAPTLRQVSAIRPNEWFSSSRVEMKELSSVSNNANVKVPALNGPLQRLKVIQGLLRYIIPLASVYVTEFVINQGLLELIIFDCQHSFGTSPRSQYKWFQVHYLSAFHKGTVMYPIGVFVSRSSIKLVQLNMISIAFLLPLLQFLNMVFLIFNAIYAFVPHFGVMCAIILYEGLIGGASYVNTFYHIHKKVDASIREFALSTVIIGDTIGLLIAGILAIPIHNVICAMQWYS